MFKFQTFKYLMALLTNCNVQTIRNIVVIFQPNILRIVGFYVRHLAMAFFRHAAHGAKTAAPVEATTVAEAANGHAATATLKTAA